MFDEKTNGIIVGVWVTLGLISIVLGEAAAVKVIGVMLLLGLGAFVFVSIKSASAGRRNESDSACSVPPRAESVPAVQEYPQKATDESLPAPRSSAKVVYHSEPEDYSPRTIYRSSSPKPEAVSRSFKGTGATDAFLQHRVQPNQKNRLSLRVLAELQITS